MEAAIECGAARDRQDAWTARIDVILMLLSVRAKRHERAVKTQASGRDGQTTMRPDGTKATRISSMEGLTAFLGSRRKPGKERAASSE